MKIEDLISFKNLYDDYEIIETEKPLGEGAFS